jgi:hypothetical protein
MHKAIRPYLLHNLQIFFPGLFICAVFYISQVQVRICLGSSEFHHVHWCQQAWANPAEVCVRLCLSFFPHVPYSYTVALEFRESTSTFPTYAETSPWCTFFVQAYRGIKSCTSLLENVSLRAPTRHVRDFSTFSVCPSNKHCPSARCAYAATVVGKDLHIFAVGAVSLYHIL